MYMRSTSNHAAMENFSSCSALVFDTDRQCWLQFSAPHKILTAHSLEEVLTILQAVEDATEDGLTAVGYVAYEAASAFDPGLVTAEANTPLVQFSLYESCQHGFPDIAQAESDLRLQLTTNQAGYLRKLEIIHELLERGDVYQVNLSHQLHAQQAMSEAEDLALFLQLYQRQPSSRSVYYRSPDLTVACVSPELFFSLDGERLCMEPMKGTRPRGRSRNEDLALRSELLGSEKERAENLMIVDMIRNDLGKIATPGTVQVHELFRIMELPSLWQQVSSVGAQSGASLGEIFTALFPCASITGAPKRRSMEVIHELESNARGVYTGAIGIVHPGRRMQFSVAIRTLVKDNGRNELSYGVGSGVVWDSKPTEEWQETLDKAKIVWDRGSSDFQLLETMACYPDQGVHLLSYHLDRLAQTARHFRFPLDLDAIHSTLADSSVTSPSRLRLLVHKDGRFELQHSPLQLQEKPVLLEVSATAVSSENPFLQHKTTNREVYDSALASTTNGDDVILWNERGELTETCIYNLYLQFGSDLVTPSLSSGLLPGTYRRMMLETGQARESVLTLDDLDRADALFVSNSVRGLQPARLIRQPARSSLGSIQ